MNTKGKLALVTGASSGMGRSIAMALARSGAEVILLARKRSLLDQTAAEINAAGGRAHAIPVDLSDPEEVEIAATKIKTETGVPDIIVNNAGSGKWRFIDETTPEEAVQMMALPYFAAFYMTRAFYREMLERNSGHIVNISSVGSRFVWPGATAYIAARWAMRGFTEALRADLHGTGVGVTLYESGVVDSPYWENNPGSRERVPKMGNLVPTVTTAQVGEAVVRGIKRNRKLIVIPFMMKMTYWQHALFPWAVQWLMTVTGYRRSAKN